MPCKYFYSILFYHILTTFNYLKIMLQWNEFEFEIWCLTHIQQYFSYIMATNFSCGGSRSTRREPSTMGKQLVNFITCGCESSAPFLVIDKAGRELTPYW